jgi:hypothetical protein
VFDREVDWRAKWHRLVPHGPRAGRDGWTILTFLHQRGSFIASARNDQTSPPDRDLDELLNPHLG